MREMKCPGNDRRIHTCRDLRRDKGHFDGLARACQRSCREDLVREGGGDVPRVRACADALANAAASLPFFSTTTLCAMTVLGICP